MIFSQVPLLSGVQPFRREEFRETVFLKTGMICTSLFHSFLCNFLVCYISVNEIT
uniref:Uncharacterized protein n=1 Tax=Anguilla anguilla TaxID=7936 RepID=A0A0E9RQ54_ANGAN